MPLIKPFGGVTLTVSLCCRFLPFNFQLPLITVTRPLSRPLSPASEVASEVTTDEEEVEEMMVRHAVDESLHS